MTDLGDLELEPVAALAPRGESAGDRVHEIAALELDRRYVDGDLEVLRPGCCFGAGLPQDPFTDRHDQASILGQRNEFGRQNLAELRMVPAQESFKAADFVTLEVDQRLVVEFELAVTSAIRRSRSRSQRICMRRSISGSKKR